MPTEIDPNSDNAPASAQTALRAAEYVRMSTEHQQYSTHNQADKIREYAKRRGIEIVRTYADEGKSGLSLKVAPRYSNSSAMWNRAGLTSASCWSMT